MNIVEQLEAAGETHSPADRVAVVALEGRVHELEARVKELEAHHSMTSTNFSKPPSSDPPGKRWRSKQPSGRKRGAQKGHAGTYRSLLPPERVDHVSVHRPAEYGHCGCSLEGAAEVERPWVHQVVELPEIRAEVVEHRAPRLCRPDCGKTSRATFPVKVSRSSFGPKLVAMGAMLTSRFRLSRRDLGAFFTDLLDVKAPSLGTTQAFANEATAALLPAYREVRRAVRQSEHAGIDETEPSGCAGRGFPGWKLRGETRWVGTATTPKATLYHVGRSRSRRDLHRLAGHEYTVSLHTRRVQKGGLLIMPITMDSSLYMIPGPVADVIISRLVEMTNDNQNRRVSPIAYASSGIAYEVRPMNSWANINGRLSDWGNRLELGNVFVSWLRDDSLDRERFERRWPPTIAILIYYGWNIRRWLRGNLKWGDDSGDRESPESMVTLTVTEAIGRLQYCGFTVVDYIRVCGGVVIISHWNGDPVAEPPPSRGLIFRMKRIGRGGRPIYVYKIRTMYPYAQYVQEFIHKRNGSESGDKVDGDFRITRWGKLVRRLWIDEVPMLVNLIRGDVKLVGVRPLSEYKLSLYPEDLKTLRFKVKPGLVPPYYADLPNSINELFESERRYLKSYITSPLRTDIVYLTKAMWNIVFKGARSA